MEIKEEDIQISPDTHAECVFSNHNYVLVINTGIPIDPDNLFESKEAEQLKQQILKNQIIADDMRKLINELMRNGERFDTWYDISNLISHLKLQGKELKEHLQNTRNEVISTLKTAMAHKQKLEKIREYCDDFDSTNGASWVVVKIRKILEET